MLTTCSRVHAGGCVSISAVRAVVLGTLIALAPYVFLGANPFTASVAWTHKFIHEKLGMTYRASTTGVYCKQTAVSLQTAGQMAGCAAAASFKHALNPCPCLMYARSCQPPANQPSSFGYGLPA
jgi:hypothetical protein